MIKIPRFVLVYLILIAAGAYISLHSDLEVPINRPLRDFPVERMGWTMVTQSTFSDKIVALLKPTDYMARRYKGPNGEVVDIYVGYHSGAKGVGEVHSPKQCLPGGGWERVREEKIKVDAEGGPITLVSALYQKAESKDLFLYWYKVKGGYLSDEYSLKASQIVNSILYRRRDASFIRVSVPYDGNEANAIAGGIDFIKVFSPVLNEFLPA